jgi:ABC-type amino acid transport substrate-binding protein
MPRLVALVASAWLLALLAAACASEPGSTPFAPGPIGIVRVGVDRAAAGQIIFSSTDQARLIALNGDLIAEWVLSDGVPTDEYVLAGTYVLEAHAVFSSDAMDCEIDPVTDNPTNCVLPTLAPGQTCHLRVTVTSDRVAEATYTVLAQGRCRLAPGLSPNIPRASD